MRHQIKTLAVAGVAAILSATSANAEEVTLKAVSAFNQGTTFSANFERFIERVNEKGGGQVQIDYLGGGGKVMNPFELANNVKAGTVDLGNLPGAFYTGAMPEADAIKLSNYTIQEERENGAWAYMNAIHEEKLNAYHLARQKDCVPFHLYTNEKVSPGGPDDLATMLDGTKIRTTPIYSAFFKSMGADLIRTAPGDVLTALERGTVKGYGWPTQGVLDLGWDEHTKYRVDPSFYRASVEVLMNLDTWNGLTDDQKAVLTEARDWMESLCAEDREINDKEKQRQAEAGIETIALDGDVADAYLERAQQAGWDALLADLESKGSPHGPAIKACLTGEGDCPKP